MPETSTSVLTPLIYLIARNGYYGVTVFFAISGFLITAQTIKKYGALANVSLRTFYLFRVARIAPLLFAILAILTTLSLFNVPRFTVAPDFNVWAVVGSILIFQFNWYYVAGVSQLLPWGPLWSLSIEELFYLFFPIACLTLRKRSFFSAGLLILILQSPFARSDGMSAIFSWLGCADAISIGCLAAVLAHRCKIAPGLLSATVMLFGLCLITFQYFAHPVEDNYVFGPTLIALGAALFLFGNNVHASSRLRLLRPMEYLGRRSYEIYLMHIPLLLTIKSIIGVALPDYVALAVSVILIGAIGELVGTYFTDPLDRTIRSLKTPIVETNKAS